MKNLQIQLSYSGRDWELTSVSWPQDSNIAEVGIHLDDNQSEELRKIKKLLPFAVCSIELEYDPQFYDRRYLLMKAGNPLAKIEYRLIRFWRFWRWWEIRIIRTLAVWDLAIIYPSEIVGWHCLDLTR